jgi:hypothetical protein
MLVISQDPESFPGSVFLSFFVLEKQKKKRVGNSNKSVHAHLITGNHSFICGQPAEKRGLFPDRCLMSRSGGV